MSEMSIRQLLLRDFCVDLPISGGWGNSMENAVVIQYETPNDYVAVEYAYLKYLGLGRKIRWRAVGQRLIQKDGKYYDKIEIEIQRSDGSDVTGQIEYFYFDISDCLGKE